MHIRKLAKYIETELKKLNIKVFKKVRNAALFAANSYIGSSDYAPIKVPELSIVKNKLILPFEYNLFKTVKEIRREGLINTSSILIEQGDEENVLSFSIYRTVPNLISISFGHIKYDLANAEGFYTSISNPVHSIIKDPITNKWVDDTGDIMSPEILDGDIKYHISYAMRYLMAINDQKQFIVEETIKQKKKKGKRIKNIKSIFRVKPPRIIRQKMKQSIPNYMEGNGKPLKVGHERRKHPRTYRADRYVNVKGQTVEIAATWVGPTSYTDPKDPNKYYKVRLDL